MATKMQVVRVRERREDSSQAARQLIKTAMKEAELERGTIATCENK